MTIYVDDNDVCPKCGAYWSTGKYWCCNGHPNPRKEAEVKAEREASLQALDRAATALHSKSLSHRKSVVCTESHAGLVSGGGCGKKSKKVGSR